MIQDVFIVGATGNIGRTLVKQILVSGDTNPDIHVNPTRIVGVASSANFIYQPRGISHEQAYSFADGQYSQSQAYNGLGHLLSVARAGHKPENSSLVFVDVTALNKPMTDFHLATIQSSPFGIVTANKNPAALSDYGIFQELTKDPNRYDYRCSVMAGAEAVSMLRDLKDINDAPKTIQGCFSGTLGYITSELEKGRKFSEIVKDAKDKGYTEPDPRDDLNGLDVARKLLVLARTAGYEVGIDDIDISPFIPQDYFNGGDVGSFLGSIKQLDAEFKAKMEQAAERGMTFRYVANLDATKEVPKLEVSLKEVPLQSPLGNLKGTSNKIVIISNSYPEENPYSVEAPGAGLRVTAQNIRRDLLYLLKDREIKIK
ncbi:hypothetical protein CMO93_04330 [Candidatus Woesearchaeota archaeon]|jgi:aspartokinase/homoserine dehydrogenase 1|nr:hypothetical protein [Candidatus Woesearchaeota archaeon]|tara:strand:- start:2823 stop:3938 length:1116 start_codon:yes stop_codon:yes gene_type:complete